MQAEYPIKQRQMDGEEDFRGDYDSAQKIWRGPKVDFGYDEDVSLGKVALDALQKDPNRIIQINDLNGRTMRAREMLQLATSMSKALHKLGLQQEDVVGVCASNTDYLLPLLLGIWSNGAVCSCMDPSVDRPTLKHFYDITKPKFVFCDRSVYRCIKEILSELSLDCRIYTMSFYSDNVRSIEDLLYLSTDEKPFRLTVLRKGGNQTAAICASSNRISHQKGVCVSHRALLECSNLLRTRNRRRVFISSTMSCISSLYTMIGSIICNFDQVITSMPFTPEMTVHLIEKYQVTDVYLTMAFWVKMLETGALASGNFSSVQAFRMAGGRVPFVIIDELRHYVGQSKVFAMYGMTELVSICSVGQLNRPYLVGKIFPNVEVCIKDDKGQRLEPCREGMIYVKTHCRWMGYYNDPTQTAKLIDGDGWIETGNFGYFDAQRNLYVVGPAEKTSKQGLNQVLFSELSNFVTQLSGLSNAYIAAAQEDDYIESIERYFDRK